MFAAFKRLVESGPMVASPPFKPEYNHSAQKGGDGHHRSDLGKTFDPNAD
ncbi:MAG TPA: hypothetical protein VI455_09075 [Terriglobia bacterium]